MISNPIQKVVSSVGTKKLVHYLCLFGVLFGALVRLVQYFSNRSLWGDEAMLALNLVDRSYLQLLQPLDYNQAAPPGFLWIEKLAIQLFGNHEYTLRLFPLIAGLVSLVAFYHLAIRYASLFAAPIAILLFACLKYSLYYATEVKQYSSDVMVALLLAVVLMPLRHQILNRQQVLFLGGFGVVCIWLSHPAVFVLAGIEAAHFLVATTRQRWQIITNRWVAYLAWLASFAGLYWFTIRSTLDNDTLTSSWGTRYPNSFIDIFWLFDAFGRFFYNPMGFLGITDGIALVVFIVGCVAVYRRDRILLLVLTAPMLVTVFASYLEKYPFRERLVLFLVPFALLILAEGIASLLVQWSERDRFVVRLKSFIGLCILSALLLLPLGRASQLIVHPTQVEEIRPVLAYIQSHQQPTDKLYVYTAGKLQFLYYAPQFDYAPANYILGKAALASGGRRNRQLEPEGIQHFQREMRRLRGKRVWLVFTATSEQEEQKVQEIVQPLGQQLDQVRQTGAFAFLYEFRA